MTKLHLNTFLESKDMSQNQLRNLFPEKFAFLKMEVEQRLRGRIVRRPKEQVWMLKTDSVLNIINIDVDIKHRHCQNQYSTDKCGM